MRVTSKGQVTIPQEIRQKLGLLANSEVEFVLEGDAVRIKKAKGRRRGEAIVARLRGKGSAIKMSTDQIMALTRGD
jgi:AbrB family looped-hinge helix DNA binding protein